jgi:hypothetical protein
MKYQADILQDRITVYLAESSPTTLDDWDEVAYSTESGQSSNLKDPSESSLSGHDDDPSNYLTKDFIPDPISFLTLARECGLLVTFSTLLYSLCRDSATRKEKLSRMTRADQETLFLGKDRMMRFVAKSGAAQLEIESWVPEDPPRYPYGHTICMEVECHTLVVRAWSKILEDVMFYGDPLAIFRMIALKIRKYADGHFNREHQFYGDICRWCKDRLASKLDDLRQSLFDELPSFFPLKDNNLNLQTTEGD